MTTKTEHSMHSLAAITVPDTKASPGTPVHGTITYSAGTADSNTATHPQGAIIPSSNTNISASNTVSFHQLGSWTDKTGPVFDEDVVTDIVMAAVRGEGDLDEIPSDPEAMRFALGVVCRFIANGMRTDLEIIAEEIRAD